jgi:hypothetical protein
MTPIGATLPPALVRLLRENGPPNVPANAAKPALANRGVRMVAVEKAGDLLGALDDVRLHSLSAGSYFVAVMLQVGFRSG